MILPGPPVRAPAMHRKHRGSRPGGCAPPGAVLRGGESMNLQHLRYAVEVANCRCITKAAARLFIGQPNLSRAIRELEDEF